MQNRQRHREYMVVARGSGEGGKKEGVKWGMRFCLGMKRCLKFRLHRWLCYTTEWYIFEKVCFMICEFSLSKAVVCVYVCVGCLCVWRPVVNAGVFVSHSPFIVWGEVSQQTWRLPIKLEWLADDKPPESSCLCLPGSRIQVQLVVFVLGCWGSTSGPHGCSARTIESEVAPWPMLLLFGYPALFCPWHCMVTLLNHHHVSHMLLRGVPRRKQWSNVQLGILGFSLSTNSNGQEKDCSKPIQGVSSHPRGKLLTIAKEFSNLNGHFQKERRDPSFLHRGFGAVLLWT